TSSVGLHPGFTSCQRPSCRLPVRIHWKLAAGHRQLHFPDCHSRPPRLSGGGGMNLYTLKPVVCRWPVVVRERPSTNDHRLSLTELEALSCALLSVLLALFGARVASHHTFGLELLAQFGIELHERARDAQAHSIGLSGDSTTAHVGQHVEVGRGLGRDQRRLRADAL